MTLPDMGAQARISGALEYRSPAEQLRELDDLKMAVRKDFARLDKALGTEQISLAEYRYYIKQVYYGKDERDILDEIMKKESRIRASIESERRTPSVHMPTVVAALFLILFGGLATLLFGLTAPGHGGLIGFVTGPVMPATVVVNQNYTGNETIPLNTTNITGLLASGELVDGSGELWLLVGDRRLLVWQGTAVASAYSVLTDKESYALNGTVNVTVSPPGTEYTLWLTDADGGKTLVQDGFVATVPGAYALDALINHSGNITLASVTFTVRNDTNASLDALRPSTQATATFTDACSDTCGFNSTGNASLRLEVATTGTLTLSDIVTTRPRANEAPVAIQDVPDFTLDLGEEASIDLANYFSDADGDNLTYDWLNAPNAAFGLDGSVLTITATKPGVEQGVVYASDLYTLTQSNIFTITVYGTLPNGTTGNATGNGTTTQNVSVPPVDTTGNRTVIPAPNTTDCSNPDPNLRPLECLQEESAKYFQDQAIYISDDNRRPIARLTPIGNLLITGQVREHAAFTPRVSDYVIGYEDDYGTLHVTVWFDSETGNVYLAGSLHEEEAHAVPPPGSYVLRNRKGITLAWVNQGRGDLYIRGNVIPYRTNIE